MFSKEVKTSMAIAGRGAHACDMCAKERARWYCAADEAYLCERCDGSVHSANPVAQRHERIKLGPNGLLDKLKQFQHCKGKRSDTSLGVTDSASKRSRNDLRNWCNTSRKRSKTPRKGPNYHSLFNRTPVIKEEPYHPTIVKEEKDDTDLLLYDLLTVNNQLGDFSASTNIDVKPEPFSPSSTLTSGDLDEIKVEEADFSTEVPIYEPFLEELIASSHEDIMETLMPSSPSLCNVSSSSRMSSSMKFESNGSDDAHCKKAELEIESSDVDTEPFHVNYRMESSAGETIDSISINEESDIDTFDVMELCSDICHVDENRMADDLKEEYPNIELWKSAYNLDAYNLDPGDCSTIFDGNPFKGKGEKHLIVKCEDMDSLQDEEVKPLHHSTEEESFKLRPLSLNLDYEDVISTWSDRGSLWTNGQRPQIVPDISHLDCGRLEFGMIMTEKSGCVNGICAQAAQVPSLVADDGREARVMRYKEKRRTRLFSKKIRYEVRKLNAERRPRMKGRFVKRAAIATVTAM
ncbi:hypothetical protein KP509_12G022400 [Ceratopteris richardii]|uniref:Uncharacterized protein n=1 Tax=Ceratopteris richardii TaxID=49495 RepID=A0A8T2TMQ4_CERRI|nr:hypothetical protein KP509_12G022400 [Ceratopteris richardii]KAH7422726.1 hypothetical protein KP509_12G022400 [Ceratopteris richardii]KAH7422727.1 hypothetical protein KP509_12G022400 [Ceratopteris richardii]KAH7422728.1 hypothetical protein KP509_12G022400 [Ceratopteris richardii]